MNVVRYKAEHLHEIDLQDGQAYLSNWITPDLAASLETVGHGYTGFEGDTPMGCAGILPVWQGRAIAWAYLSKHVTRANFIEVHNIVARFLETCYIQRIEMTVDCDFKQGHRWARALGFVKEADRLRAYRPDGGDCALYARVL